MDGKAVLAPDHHAFRMHGIPATCTGGQEKKRRPIRHRNDETKSRNIDITSSDHIVHTVDPHAPQRLPTHPIAHRTHLPTEFAKGDQSYFVLVRRDIILANRTDCSIVHFFMVQPLLG